MKNGMEDMEHANLLSPTNLMTDHNQIFLEDQEMDILQFRDKHPAAVKKLNSSLMRNKEMKNHN